MSTTVLFSILVNVTFKTYTIQTPAAMFKGFTVTQFHTPETAQAAMNKTKDKTKKAVIQNILVKVLCNIYMVY